jgi:serine/threonine-protein kinase
VATDRWHLVTEIFHAALARDGATRDAFVADRCKEDGSLRAEVEALLSAHENAGSFGDAPAFACPAQLLAAGSSLGPYRIDTLIGAGGMGEVYRAMDTRLGRTVAIKILPSYLRSSTDLRTRFEREAKIIAGLAHPHICTLHDIGEHAGAMFLVMEHLEGETLAARLEKGPPPLPQALTIAIEIAEALSAAHRHGVIHRDLKPGNVMLTKSGAKLLDFGLAKLLGHGEQDPFKGIVGAPTPAVPLTGQGAIVGTLQYMAPEQIEGKPADARTDLWALGAILYEMVAGKRVFEGTSAASLSRAILEREPASILTLQPLTPPVLDRLVRQCLAKSAEDRPDTAHDVSNELRRLADGSSVGALTGVRPFSTGWLLLRTAALVLVGALLASSVWWRFGRGATIASPSAIVHSSMDVRPADEVVMDGRPRQTALVWTPDGQSLVFIGRHAGVRQLYVRRLDVGEARPLPNTEGAMMLTVSADGQWVAFWSDRAIRKVPFGGGPAIRLAPVLEPPYGLAWDVSGRLFFAIGSGPDYGLGEVLTDGTTRIVKGVESGQLTYVLPSLLPGGDTILYTVRKHMAYGDEEATALNLRTGAGKILLKNAVDARYVAPGYLVFLRHGSLFAAPFDPGALQVLREETPVLDTIDQGQYYAAVTGTGAGQFAVSSTGTLAWVQLPLVRPPETQLVAVDRRGQVTPLNCPPGSFNLGLRVSPDGRRLATTVLTGTQVGVWSCDLERGGLTLVVGADEAAWPVWSHDGSSLFYFRLANARATTAVQKTDGSSEPQTVFSAAGVPTSCTRDGEHLAVTKDRDIFVVTMKDGKPSEEPFLATSHQEAWPDFSPDGRWLAYASDISGRFEVYVRPYARPGATMQASVAGGDSPAWNPNGRELFFVSPPDSSGARWMMVAEFDNGSFLGPPRRLFASNPNELRFSQTWARMYDVAKNGERFYAIKAAAVKPPPPVTHINLFQNWTEELKAKVPVGK